MRELAAWGIRPVHCSGSRQTAQSISTVDASLIFALQLQCCYAQAGLQVMKLLLFHSPCMAGAEALALIMFWCPPQC